MRFTIFPLLVIAALAYASWVCPVFRTEIADPTDPAGLGGQAELRCWEVVITPTAITDESLQGFAEWDYMVCERLSMVPVTGTEQILFCIDLGVVPEGVRELLSVSVDGLELLPCSSLARPSYPADHVAGVDTLYLVRQDPHHPGFSLYVLDSMDSYRSRFENEDDFRSAVPETARFYTVLFDIPVDSEPFDVEAVYIAKGWAYVTGAEPLDFTLLQPGLWPGSVGEGSILVDMTGIPDREQWLIRFMEEEYTGDGPLRFRVEDFDVTDITVFPVLTVIPPGLQGN